MEKNFFQLNTYNTCLVLTLTVDELDLKNSPKILKEIDIKLAELNHPSLIIDLNNVTYIDSMGISLLVSINKGIHSNGKRMALYCNNESIQQVFDVVQMERYLKLFHTLDESVDYIKKKGDNVVKI